MDKATRNNDLLRFIKLYRSHEILWNMNHSSYRRKDLKLKAYEAISTNMKMSVQEVKKKIKSLRTAYSAEKAKVEKSKKYGGGKDSVYTPTVYWYNEMTFLNAYLIRRATFDNSNQEKEDIGTLIEMSLDAQTNDLSCSETEQAKTDPPTSSKKRKRSPEPKSNLGDTLDKLIAINKDATVFETFGKNVAMQMKEFPEEEACLLMADIQLMLSKRKMDLLRKIRDGECQVISVEVLKPIQNFQSRASTPLSPSSNSNPSSDVFSSTMSDAGVATSHDS